MTRVRRVPVLLAASCICAAAVLAESYPPPFPRKDASKVFENDRVEVWDVTWPKGQPTAMHEHPYDQLSVTLRGGAVKVTRLGATPKVSNSTLGSVALTPKGTIHVEEGVSDVPQHKIMLQLKPSPSPSVSHRESVPGAFPREGAVKLMENDRIVAWDFTWKPGQKVPRHLNYLDSVTVFLEGGTIRAIADRGGLKDTPRKAGEVVFSSFTPDAQTEEAVSGTPRAVIVELK